MAFQREPYVSNYPGPAPGEDPGPPAGEYDVSGSDYGQQQPPPMPQRAPQQGPLARFGGKVLGGLANFAKNADFNGAYLAGRGEYAAADASNERFAADQKERHNLAIHKQMVERLTGIDPRTPEGNRDAFAVALEFGDEKLADGIIRMKLDDGPLSSVHEGFGTGGGQRNVLVGPSGKRVFEGAPYTPTPMVNIGASGMNPYQQAQVQQQYNDDYNKRSEPQREIARRLKELDGLIEQLGGTEPNAFQSEAAATAFAKGLKPSEAVMRDDIQRILGQGFSNIARGYLNLPQRASLAQLREMSATLRQIDAVGRLRQQAIDAEFRQLTSPYGVQSGVNSPAAGDAAAERLQAAAPLPSDLPE